MAITSRAFQPLADCDLVWRLLCEAYQPLHANGIPAPFFEYALTSAWMDRRFLHHCRLWLEDGRAVGFAFYENPVTDVYFSLLPGYDCLAVEMIAHAEQMPGGAKELVLFPGQTALIDAAQARGYRLAWTQEDHTLDLSASALSHPLPQGFRLIDPLHADPVKLARCTWYGFNHGDTGAFEGWLADDPGDAWSPQKAYLNVESTLLAPSPHATPEHSVIIADGAGEYACFAGMWLVSENQLAYLEPLCTVPEHRRKGLAAAALSILQDRMKQLGARYMTGGGEPFYRKLGYAETARWLHMRK